MEMLQLNDLLPSAQWEINWTILSHQHEELTDDKEYIIFEHYCANPACDCKKLVADIQEMGPDGEPIGTPSAIISYDWSSNETSCYPTLMDASPRTKTALDLLRVYDKHIHQPEYLLRIKNQYKKIKELALQKQQGRFRSSKKDVGRNDLCPCGSNKKYKKCCLS